MRPSSTGSPVAAEPRRLTNPLSVKAPHALTVDDVARELAGDLEHGLTPPEAEARLVRFGANRLPRSRRPAYAAIALRQFADPLVGLLIGAAFVSFLIGERVEAAAIAAIVILNAAARLRPGGRARSGRCSRSVTCSNRGRASFAPAASARSGSSCSFPAICVLLREGERVPADGGSLDGRGARRRRVDPDRRVRARRQGNRTGTRGARRWPSARRWSTPGTAVTRGRGRAIVTATGAATELGEIAGLTEQAKTTADAASAPRGGAHPR